MSEWKEYRKTAITEARPYVEGEDLSKISVSEGDTPGPGGMIARNPNNPEDQWYIDKLYFSASYEAV